MNIVDAPTRFDKNAYNQLNNKKPSAKDARKAWRMMNPGREEETAYLNRKFVSVDGEGVTDSAGNHRYILLAVEGCEPLIGKNGLSTRECLRYLWQNLDNRNINIIYGGSYDFNLWIRNLMDADARRLYNSKYTGKPLEYMGYQLKWVRGKRFSITYAGRMVTINDVLPFFQAPFIKACDDYLGTYEGRDILVREKARRAVFTVSEITSIDRYNQLELELLNRLAVELRERLYKVRLKPRRWDGPGAIAAALFSQHNIKGAKGEVPPEVAKAARYAYAGGRFEMFKYGGSRDPVYEYDINSAYPAALREVPNLSAGSWKHRRKGQDYSGVPGADSFAIYRVLSDARGPEHLPNPIYCRGSNGSVSYPQTVVNWVWSPEYGALLRYAEKHNVHVEVMEYWTFETHQPKPFAFIDKLYQERKTLKARGDGAHVGIKLALNSMYGKLAQQVGWIPATKDHPARIPPYHQLEWAGFVTSWCRAKILDAISLNPGAIVAIETDALFSTVPLDLHVGGELGDWELTEFTSLTYVQSGHYYGTLADGTEIVRCRGVDRGEITREAVEATLSLPASERYLQAPLTRFFGLGIALARGMGKWGNWYTETKSLAIQPTGKRIHAGCCDGVISVGEWHKTLVPVPGGESLEYPVEWINPNPEMTELAEMRESENYQDME